MKFVEAPPRSGRDAKYDWKKIAAELRDNPGQWGIVEGNEYVKGTASAAQGVTRFIKSGVHPSLPLGEFESVTRGNVVYARYVGKKASRARK